MNIFSVTALIFRTHSLSLTIGTLASLIRRGMGPAEIRKHFRDLHLESVVVKHLDH